MAEKNAQYSLEYIVTIGIVFGILLLFMGVYWIHQSRSTKEIDNTMISSIGTEIIDTVKAVNSAGGFSRTEISLNSPQSVQTVYVTGPDSKELVINYTQGAGVANALFRSDIAMMDLMNHSISASKIYVLKSSHGGILLCTEPKCDCKANGCCTSGLCGTGICKGGLLCSSAAASKCIGEIMPMAEICGNFLDDDCDGVMDNGCAACSNSIDDDMDGRIDLLDPGCADASDNDETSACANGMDDDGDGLTDWADDPGCEGPWDNDESDTCVPEMMIGMVGHWAFDGNYLDSAGVNDAYACTALVYDSSNTPAPNVNSNPVFVTEGARTFIRFNTAGDRNCAVIDDDISYHLPEGTISFWMRYRGDMTANNFKKRFFSKDANMCDIRSDEADVASGPEDIFGNWIHDCDGFAGGDANCDCGHIGMQYDPLEDNNITLRFQNDGNGLGIHYRLKNDRSKLLPETDWNNQWHLVTITFSQDNYTLFIDGEAHDVLLKADDADTNLEGMLGNKWRLWLGAIYPDGSASQYQLRTPLDMDDFRIYDKPLEACSVHALYMLT